MKNWSLKETKASYEQNFVCTNNARQFTRIYFLREDCALGTGHYESTQFWWVSDISLFPRIPVNKLLGNSQSNPYTKLFKLDMKYCFTCANQKCCKYYDRDCKLVYYFLKCVETWK